MPSSLWRNDFHIVSLVLNGQEEIVLHFTSIYAHLIVCGQGGLVSKIGVAKVGGVFEAWAVTFPFFIIPAHVRQPAPTSLILTL